MPIRLRKPVLQTSAKEVIPLELKISPYMDIDPEKRKQSLRLFIRWLDQEFSGRPRFGLFEVAEKLNVHRLVSDTWVQFAEQSAREIIYFGSMEIGDGYGCHYVKFLQKLDFPTQVEITVPPYVRDYDPWTNREWDSVVIDARFPDHFIDRYFEILCDESYLVNGKQRRRPNGAVFYPLLLTEHPRYDQTARAEAEGQAYPSSRRRYESEEAPPLEWKDYLDRAIARKQD